MNIEVMYTKDGKIYIACETCGEPTTMLGTKRCDSCYEVEARIGQYLRSGNGRKKVLELLKKGGSQWQSQ